MSMDEHSMESISDTYQTLHHNRNNQFVITNQPVGHKRSNSGHQKQGCLCCNGIASVCLGLLCILLLACTITQHVMYTIAEKGHLESIKNLTLQKEDLLNALSGVNKDIQMGWWYYNFSVYYTPLNEHMQWSQSRQYCQRRNADLVIINSLEEQQFIEKLTTTDVWIGLTNRDHTGVWKWVDGFPVTTGFWSPKHPNLGHDLCVKSTKNSFTERTWQANSCYCTSNYICEKKIFKGL